MTVAWSGLSAGQHYLGLVEYSDGTDVIASTAVAVNP